MQNAKNQIRTRRQGNTPFFPNMLNNGNVEVCLKEDVDKVLAEKDKEIQYWIDLAIKRQLMYEKCRCTLSKVCSRLKRNKIVSNLMAEGIPERTAYHKAKKIMEKMNEENT